MLGGCNSCLWHCESNWCGSIRITLASPSWSYKTCYLTTSTPQEPQKDFSLWKYRLVDYVDWKIHICAHMPKILLLNLYRLWKFVIALNNPSKWQNFLQHSVYILILPDTFVVIYHSVKLSGPCGFFTCDDIFETTNGIRLTEFFLHRANFY